MLELLLFGGIETPPNPLLAVVTDTQNEIQIEKELTVQEKIDSNYYNCDESIQYIRADNAQCLAKPVYVPKATKNTSYTIRNGSGSPPLSWWGRGQCTSHVASKRPVGYWNNAISWTWQAQRDGWATGTTPRVGAIGQKGNHVVYVTGVGNGTFSLSEMNYAGLGVVTYRTVSSAGWNFIY